MLPHLNPNSLITTLRAPGVKGKLAIVLTSILVLPLILTVVFTLAAASPYWPGIEATPGKHSWTDAGSLGEATGLAAAFFGGVAAFGLLLTFAIQFRSISKQNNDIDRALTSLNDTAIHLEHAVRALQRDTQIEAFGIQAKLLDIKAKIEIADNLTDEMRSSLSDSIDELHKRLNEQVNTPGTG